MLLQQKNEFFVKRHFAVVLFLHCTPLTLRAGRRQRGKEFFSCLPSIYPCSARCAPWAMLG